MCGRFAIATPSDRVRRHFQLDELDPFPPRYNIAPTQPILIIRRAARSQGSNRSPHEARLVKWGLIPSWAKNPADLPLMINARSETAAGKPAFRGPLRHGRILIPADGFYEWRRTAEGGSQPYWVSPVDGGLVAFAGLYSDFLAADGSEIETAAILTTRANRALAAIHHRMPIAIAPEHFDRWLNCDDNEPRHVADLMEPAPDDFWQAVPVSTRVNKVSNMDPSLQTPIADEKSIRRSQIAPQPDLFGD